MHPDQISEVKAWFAKACEDLRAAEHDLTADPPLMSDIAFHCQQTIEKAIKGFLVFKGKTFDRTHDLDELAESAVECDPLLSEVLQPAKELTVYATMYRYPGADDLTLDDLVDDLALAKRVFFNLLGKLPPEADPTQRIR
jgi:HEPN domain-containing protein